MKPISLVLIISIVVSLFLVAGCAQNAADENTGNVNANTVQAPDENTSSSEVASAESVITFRVLDENKTEGI